MRARRVLERLCVETRRYDVVLVAQLGVLAEGTGVLAGRRCLQLVLAVQQLYSKALVLVRVLGSQGRVLHHYHRLRHPLHLLLHPQMLTPPLLQHPLNRPLLLQLLLLNLLLSLGLLQLRQPPNDRLHEVPQVSELV
jgi:hypothetical protein